MTDIKIEPSEEVKKSQKFLSKQIVPVAGGILVIIAIIVAWLITVFYPQNYNGGIIESDSSTQQQ